MVLNRATHHIWELGFQDCLLREEIFLYEPFIKIARCRRANTESTETGVKHIL